MTEATQYAAHGSRRHHARGTRVIGALAYTVAAACLLPMLAVALAAVTGGTDTITHLMETVLPS